MSLYDKIKAGVDEIIQMFKDANEDGKIQFNEAVGMSLAAMGHFIKLISAVVGYTNEERQECLEKCLDRFVDEVLVPWDIPNVPNWIEAPVDRALKMVVDQFAPAMVAPLVQLLDVVDDWLPSPGPTPGPLPGPIPPLPTIDDGRIIAMCQLPPADMKGCGDCDCDGSKE